jgi:hypothetical protein
MTISLNQSNLICEWLGDFFLPKFSNKIHQNGHLSLYDYFLQIKTNQSLIEHELLLYSDILNYFEICNQSISNLVYIIWLFNLFEPLLLTTFITLFLLPLIICILVYASSFFMFISKHWNKLKVIIL